MLGGGVRLSGVDEGLPAGSAPDKETQSRIGPRHLRILMSVVKKTRPCSAELPWGRTYVKY